MTTVISRAMLETFRADMAAAMAAVYDKHGLVASPGRITFGATNFSFKVEASLKSELPANASVQFNPVFVQGVKRHGYAYGGVTIEKLGKKFVSAGREYTFLGINQTGHFAVGKQTVNGKEYKVRPHELAVAKWLD